MKRSVTFSLIMTTRVAADIDDRKVFRRLPAVETIYAIKYRKWNFFFVLYYVLFPVNKYVCMYVCMYVHTGTAFFFFQF